MSKNCKGGCSPKGSDGREGIGGLKYKELSPAASLREVIEAFNDFSKRAGRKNCELCERLMDIELIHPLENFEGLAKSLNTTKDFVRGALLNVVERLEALEAKKTDTENGNE